ncbi:MAG: DUF1934 domain-containing protein [Gorillibacterium sp.]|nr:DUF1934 domain-containing protein [Gorillibacterium sp.]
MNIKTKVTLTVTSYTNEETIRLSYLADRYVKGVNQYFRYIEDSNEGMGQTVTLLKVGPEEIRIIRHGDIESEQTFAVGELRPGFYQTKQGTLQLETRTSHVSVHLEEGIGTVEWTYEMQLAGEPVGSYRLNVEIGEA